MKLPDYVSPGEAPQAKHINDLVDVVRALLKPIPGNGIKIELGHQGLFIEATGDAGKPFVVKITGNQAADSPARNRYKYSWTEVVKTDAGYGGWTDGSRSGTYTLYNTIEDVNNTTGTFGNGVTKSNLTGSFALKPIPNGAIVQVIEVAGEYWTTYENGVDGSC